MDFIKCGSEENGKYYGGVTQQGMCYKDEEKFLFSPEEICYCSEIDLENHHFGTENDEAGWTGNDIIELFRGDVGLAYWCFLGCDWQSPSTWKDEMEQFEESEDIANMSQRGKELVERALRKEGFE